MRTRAVLVIVGLATAVAVSLGASATGATTTPCRGVLGPVAVENVVVPGRASCLLDATTVSGNVLVEPGGALRATMDGVIGGDIIGKKNAAVSLSRIRVGGDVECGSCRRVNVFETEVDGDVRLESTVETVFISSSPLHGDLALVGGAAGAEVARGGAVDGDFVFSKNRGPLTMVRESVGGDAIVVDNVSLQGFTLTENLFGKDLVFSRNTGPSTLTLNSIAETLACFGNDPPPAGSENVAAQVEGQCVGFQPTPSG